MLRLFAAIAIPEDIAEVLRPRRQGLPGARWHSDEQLHITLRFFGDVREDRADDLDAELSTIAPPAFDLELTGVGHFGEAQDVRAIWAGVAQSEPLRSLAKRCEAAARRAGLAPDSRNYHPHVTLAYLSRPDPHRLIAWEQDNNLLHSPPFRVDRFGLYSSHRTHDGSAYRLERDYRLG